MAIILERNEIISPKSANLWRSTRLQPADRGGADNLCTAVVLKLFQEEALLCRVNPFVAPQNKTHD